MSQGDFPEYGDGKSRLVESIKYPLISKALSDRLKKRDDRLWDGRRRGSEGKGLAAHGDNIPEVITYLLMKEKFDQIYRKIQGITVKDEQFATRLERKTMIKKQQDSEGIMKIIHVLNGSSSPEICKIRTSHLQPRKIPSNSDGLEEILEISTVTATDGYKHSKNSSNPYIQVQLMRKTRYRKKMLEPITKSKMSNNIKDYLSVQKISLKQVQESIIDRSSHFRRPNQSNLLGLGNPERSDHMSPDLSKQCKTVDQSKKKVEILKRKVIVAKFKPPFDLYYYRDFIWKVAFSNQMVVEPVQDYENKIKFSVGPGNNCNLLKGIMKRRPWFVLCEKPQEANFIWTQIKVSSIFIGQRKGDSIQILPYQQRKTLQQKESFKNKDDRLFHILNELEREQFQEYWSRYIDKQRKMKENMKIRTKIMNVGECSLSTVKNTIRLHNHFCNNFIIGNKKALFKTMSDYYSAKGKDVFHYLPLTFHIKNGLQDDQYLKFLQYFYAISKQNKFDSNTLNKFNAWIVKPGENTNRGNGIIVCLELNEIKSILKKKQKHNDGSYKTYILQKYIEKPLLYKKRKFDLRHYIMLNCSNGIMKGYWYKEGYVRTTSSQYTLKLNAGGVHLTNDAVQKYLPDYGKYQKGNKITYEDLDAYMKKHDPSFDFWQLVYPKMKEVASDAIRASAKNIDPERKTNFQIFGLDFMIDESYRVWLIEVNTNPCLETTCPVLSKIIPRFIENTFQICIDPLFPAPLSYVPKYQDYLKNLNDQNYFELVFDERMEDLHAGQVIISGDMQEDDDVFDDDGQDFGDN